MRCRHHGRTLRTFSPEQRQAHPGGGSIHPVAGPSQRPRSHNRSVDQAESTFRRHRSLPCLPDRVACRLLLARAPHRRGGGRSRPGADHPARHRHARDDAQHEERKRRCRADRLDRPRPARGSTRHARGQRLADRTAFRRRTGRAFALARHRLGRSGRQRRRQRHLHARAHAQRFGKHLAPHRICRAGLHDNRRIPRGAPRQRASHIAQDGHARLLEREPHPPGITPATARCWETRWWTPPSKRAKAST